MEQTHEQVPKKKIKTYVYVLWMAGLILIPPLMLSESIDGVNFQQFLLEMQSSVVWLVFGVVIYGIAVYVFKRSKSFLRYMKLTSYFMIAITSFHLREKKAKIGAAPVTQEIRATPTTEELVKSQLSICKATLKSNGLDSIVSQKICNCYTEKLKNKLKYEELTHKSEKDSAAIFLKECIYEYD